MNFVNHNNEKPKSSIINVSKLKKTLTLNIDFVDTKICYLLFNT